MIPPPFSYYRAMSIDDATQALASGGEDAKYLAGGMSLIPVLKMRLSAPPLLVDIGALRDLSYVSVEGDVVRVGALTRHCDMMANPILREYLPILSDVAYEVGDAQVRARGTLGGVLAHADSAGDYCTVAVMLDAEIVTSSRTVAAADFFQGFMTTALAPDELITEVRFPVMTEGHEYVKFRRRRSDWAIIGVGVQRDRDRYRIGLTNAGAVVSRGLAGEEVLAAGGSAREAARAIAEAASPLADLPAEVEYKKSLIETLTSQALAKVGA